MSKKLKTIVENTKALTKKGVTAIIFFTFMSSMTFASTTDQYPWTVTLKKIMDSLSGPVAYACAGIAVVLAGLAMAFLDLQGGAKKFVQAALGISIAFGAVTIMSTMFTIPSATIF